MVRYGFREASMNVGLFGGTFNPIHKGHIEVISHVKSTFNLDTVYLIPSAVPPHKTTTNLAPADYRLEMVKQAVENISGFIVSDVEIQREGKSFSIDTIQHFTAATDNGSRLYFIMGSDAFFDIDTWKNSVEIFRLTYIIVMLRAGDTRNLNDIELFLQNRISPFYKIASSGSTINYQPLKSDKNLKSSDSIHTDNKFKTVHICYVPEIPISSTMIRDKIRAEQSIKGLVPPAVEAIIYQKQLYI